MTTATEETKEAKPGVVNIDGVEYRLDQLSDEARNQLLSIRGTDMEIARLRQLLAITQTARSAYAAALKAALPAAPEK